MKFDENYRLKRIANLCHGAERILDIGCSQIPNRHLKGHRELLGLDINEKKLTPNYKELVLGDVMKLPYPFDVASFDCVVLGEVIEHFENPSALLKAVKTILKPGGFIVLSTPNPNSLIERILTINLSQKYFYTSEHRMLYPQRWLIRLLKDTGYNNISLHSGGMIFPFFGVIPFPRPWCYQTIAKAIA